MDIFSLIVAALAGISANFLFHPLKKYLSHKKQNRITVKLPDGVGYEFSASKDNKMEVEKLIRSLMYSAEKKQELNISSIQMLDDVIQPSLKALKNKFNDSDISVELEGFDKLPRVLADQSAIQQVVFNLLMNAVHHSPRKSTIKISASVKEEKIEIRFINPTMAGIREEETERIFKMGFRGAKASLREPSGMGAGLYVIKNLLDARGGDVAVRADNRMFVTTIKLPLNKEKHST